MDQNHKIVITLEIMVTIPEIQEITARIPVMEITVVISKKISCINYKLKIKIEDRELIRRTFILNSQFSIKVIWKI